MAVLKKLGWDRELTADERRVIELIGGDKVDAVGRTTCRWASSAWR